MPGAASRWGVNPVALAQLINGEALPLEDWRVVQEALKAAFKVDQVRHLFETDDGKPPGLKLFQDLAGALREPLKQSEIEQLALVKQLMARYGERDPDFVRRILPYLVPVADAVFTTPDDPAAAPDIAVAGYYGTSMPRYVAGDGVSYLDPVQGNAADCYLISSLIALAWSWPEAWSARVRAAEDRSAPTARYQYAFYNGSETDPPFFVEPRFPEFKGLPVYAHSADRSEAWAAMFEKAYVMQRSARMTSDPLPHDYRLISDDRMQPQVACQMLAGGVSDVKGPYDVKPLAAALQRCDARGVTREPTIAWTWESEAWNKLERLKALGFDRTGLVANHAYAVLGVIPRDPQPEYVVLRNPWGCAPECPEGHKSGTWRPGDGRNGVSEIELNQNGVFALRADWFSVCFTQVGWVTQSSG